MTRSFSSRFERVVEHHRHNCARVACRMDVNSQKARHQQRLRRLPGNPLSFSPAFSTGTAIQNA
jgi:hypothetical protein